VRAAVDSEGVPQEKCVEAEAVEVVGAVEV
jgi:hypothetical protein